MLWVTQPFKMKLRVRGFFTAVCAILICIMLYINHKVTTYADSNDFIKNPNNIPNGAHLQVLRKDLDESNYKSDSLKSDNLQNSINGRSNDDEITDSFENDVIKKIRDTIHTSEIFKNKESLLKLVDVIKTQANNKKFDQLKPAAFGETEENLPPFRISWFGRPGNDTEILRLTTDHLYYLKKIKPYKRRFKNVHPLGSGLFKRANIRNLTSSEIFHREINQYKLYTDQKNIDRLLHDLATLPIISLKQHTGGTQIKFVFTLNDGSRAMFKPMRFPRERGTLDDHYYWSDFERHTAEISAFHLDRVLGFNRIPPVSGRTVNITTEIRRFADEDLENTFFNSPAGNLCFYGQCDYYCDSSHAVCGHPDTLEGSVMAYLPSSNELARTTWRNPWKRTYSKRKRAEWEKNHNYCEKIRRKQPYSRGRRLLDLMDLAVFDFLSGNLDRHHYEMFTAFGNFTNPLHLDNGRAFGRPRFDDLSILAPVTQCCLMRYSTFLKLIHFNDGPMTLSKAMQASLEDDPVDPVLLERHYLALDRRVKIILKTMYDCLRKLSMPYKAIVDDGF